eukprot:m.76394 g.76394  ORF g.76394 m.76394 type:complete len:99 (+) comp11879_c0_seq1:252-548(+)
MLMLNNIVIVFVVHFNLLLKQYNFIFIGNFPPFFSLSFNCRKEQFIHREFFFSFKQVDYKRRKHQQQQQLCIDYLFKQQQHSHPQQQCLSCGSEQQSG